MRRFPLPCSPEPALLWQEWRLHQPQAGEGKWVRRPVACPGIPTTRHQGDLLPPLGDRRTCAVPPGAPCLYRQAHPHRVRLDAAEPADRRQNGLGFGGRTGRGRVQGRRVAGNDDQFGLTSAASAKASPSSSGATASSVADLLLAREDRRTFLLTALSIGEKTAADLLFSSIATSAVLNSEMPARASWRADQSFRLSR